MVTHAIHLLILWRFLKAKNKDIIKDTISRPEKRYDKVKNVKTEYIKTEAHSTPKTKRKTFHSRDKK